MKPSNIARFFYVAIFYVAIKGKDNAISGYARWPPYVRGARLLAQYYYLVT